jgi:hypothetical protein
MVELSLDGLDEATDILMGRRANQPLDPSPDTWVH